MWTIKNRPRYDRDALRYLSKRLVRAAFSGTDGCAELLTLKRSVRSS